MQVLSTFDHGNSCCYSNRQTISHGKWDLELCLWNILETKTQANVQISLHSPLKKPSPVIYLGALVCLNLLPQVRCLLIAVFIGSSICLIWAPFVCVYD
ncbi:hypothetical protein BDQ12DRAFT_143462 [Crucibulum laeve]|uniref:Uncharacterized protein n=1 Tax=Crucibulum laeve TaxID=68775 RepID=A0A5C3LX35_9AGAR|nr:hypothetical protein BDQ12DRAFT_143462 [Crucibulum laeve]